MQLSLDSRTKKDVGWIRHCPILQFQRPRRIYEFHKRRAVKIGLVKTAPLLSMVASLIASSLLPHTRRLSAICRNLDAAYPTVNMAVQRRRDSTAAAAAAAAAPRCAIFRAITRASSFKRAVAVILTRTVAVAQTLLMRCFLGYTTAKRLAGKRDPH